MPTVTLRNNVIYSIVGLLLILTVFFAGYYVGRFKTLKNISSASSQQIDTKSYIKVSPLFQDQTATIKGKIVKVEGNTVTITDANNRTETFAISDNLGIYKASVNYPVASASSDIKAIDINKEASVVLRVVDGAYQVVSVVYPQPFQDLRPVQNLRPAPPLKSKK